MSSETQPQSSATAKNLVNKDNTVTKLTEWATADVDSIEAMKALFDSQGVSYTSGEELTGDYRIVTGVEKQMFLERVQGSPAFAVRWEFYTDKNTKREFVALHVIIQSHGKWIINDGSKSGFYGQLSETTATRLANNWPEDRAKAGLDAPRGFIKNDPYYYFEVPRGHKFTKVEIDSIPEEYRDGTRQAIRKSDLDSIPEEYRKLAHPSWKLQF